MGIAVSDPTGTLATPWRTVSGAGSPDSVADRVAALLAELAEGDAPVARAIEQRTGLPVALQDERLTSVEAEQRLALRERDWRRRKARLDAAAAAVILQDHLDQGRLDQDHLDAGAGREGT